MIQVQNHKEKLLNGILILALRMVIQRVIFTQLKVTKEQNLREMKNKMIADAYSGENEGINF